MVFDKQWFQTHQRKLLWLLNTPIIKIWFRWVLRVHNDLKLSEKIAQIQPNNYKVIIDRESRKVRADFRTNNKFSARLYHAFKPIWWTMHFFDWLCLDDLDYSFGFDTLTVYPDAGTGGTTVDGVASRASVDETFSTIRAGAGTGSNDTSTEDAVASMRASTTSDQFKLLERGAFTFDTSSIDTGTVDSADFSFYGLFKESGLGETAMHVAGASLANANAVVNADFQNISRTTFGNVAYASFDTAGYNDITLNASGESNIDTSGISEFSTQVAWDINNSFTGTWASNGWTYFYGAMADSTGTTQDPKLVVTYTTPSTDTGFLLMF